MTDSNRARFMGKVKHLDNGCWEFTGSIRPDGYGAFWLNGETIAAHRAAYQLFRGELPAGLLIAHTCDHRACVNPAHLMAVTPQENVRDMVAKGRGNPTRGERHRGAKITLQQRNDILARYAAGESSVKLGTEFGLSSRYIRHLAAGRAWGWADGNTANSTAGGGRSKS